MGILNSSEDYEVIFKDSINHFIAQFGKGETNFLAERMILFRVMQSMDDPSLEFIWLYSALTFHTSNLSLQELPNKVVIVKDLFQLIVSCSESCSGSQRVAVLAPVLYVLCSISENEVCIRGEIEGLVEGIVSYITICCVDRFEEEDDSVLGTNLMGHFVDLLRVWNVDQLGKGCVIGDALRLYFPLLNDQVRDHVNARCGMRFLAGVVIVQFVLFRLCLRVSRKENQGGLKVLLSQAIAGFQNSYFLDLLLRMMLEPSLPVTSLLESEEEIFLRRVLYDAVLLGELPIIEPGGCGELHGSHLKNMFLLWLLVADNAIEFARLHGAGNRATYVSYTEAFSRSNIPDLLIKLVAKQVGIKERPNTPNPKALISWLLVLEDHGIQIFEDSALRAKATLCNSRQDSVLPKFTPVGSYPSSYTFFSMNGPKKVCLDQEMVSSVHCPISDNACAVDLTSMHGRRKRDEEMNEEEPKAKSFKCDFYSSPVNAMPFSLAVNDTFIDGTNGKSAANRMSTGDEEMEEME